MTNIFDKPEVRGRLQQEFDRVDDITMNQINTNRFFVDFEGNITWEKINRKRKAEARLIKLLTESKTERTNA